MTIETVNIKEKRHRLPREYYRGMVDVSFTLCIKDRLRVFTDPNVITTFIDILSGVMKESQCTVPVYCFMPDHLHLIVQGLSPAADLWRFVVRYKQRTGFWMSRHTTDIAWQKDFYDHIIRKDDSLSRQIRYILDNPVRKGMVSSWEEYQFKGSLGCKLEEVLAGIR